MIRAVLDANVFVSAFLTPRSAPAAVFRAWQSERYHLLVSHAILGEIGQVLRYPKIASRLRWSEERLLTFLDDLTHLAIVTPGRLALAVISEDPMDDRYLECAVEGAADYLVSGDRHLLNLGQYQGVSICTPRTFLESLPGR